MFESVFAVSLIPTDPVRRMQLNYPSVPPEFLHGSRSVKFKLGLVAANWVRMEVVKRALELVEGPI